MSRILDAGKNCWRLDRADRVSFLVDAASYFDVLASAMERAQDTIAMVGWDFHSEMFLRPERNGEPPLRLCQHLNDISAQKRDLRVYILAWDYAPIFVFEREFFPLAQFRVKTGPRVRFRFADDHPVGASHHQKIAVIDDKLAFLGGLDVTISRWDDREHRAHDDRRRLPDGNTYGPFHDVQLALDGAAAAALGELVRERWRQATGARLSAPSGDGDPWPDQLPPSLNNVDVGLARTQAAHEKRQPVREVERLYLDAIAAAKRTIYIENQYLTSKSVGDALLARLGEDDGPEIVIITPKEQSGRLEQITMGVLRAKLARRLRAVDRHNRIRIVSPVVDGTSVKVHAKVMVVDDWFMRVGSANLSNRSMGLDSECDAAIEANGDRHVKRAIVQFRDSLLAEHLGASRDEVSAVIERQGLAGAIDTLRGQGKSLEDLDTEIDESVVDLLPDDSVLDPDRGLDEALVKQLFPEGAAEQGKRRLPRAVAGVVFVLALTALWMWTPLSQWAQPQTLARLAEPLSDQPLGTAIAAFAFGLATLLMVPVVALIVVAVLLFGAWGGFATGLVGSLLGASAGYGIGHLLWRDTVRRLAKGRLNPLTQKLAKRGFIAVTAVRIIPIAPFTVINLVAGSSRLGFRDFLLGTVVGMAPGLFVLAVAADRVVEAARDPSFETIAVAVAVLATILIGFRWLRNLLERAGRDGKPAEGGSGG